MEEPESPQDMRPGDEASAAEPATGEVPCPECGGTGRAGDSECANCSGTGTVTEAVGGG